MNTFTQQIFQDLSSIEKNYTPAYRDYKNFLTTELEQIAPPTFRQEYWKNINLDFLNQKWHYLKENVIHDEKLTQEYLKNLVGDNGYIDIIFINGFFYSLGTKFSDPSIKDSLKLKKVGGNYDQLLQEKKEIFSFFQRKNLLKNWFLCFNEILNDEVVTIKLSRGKKLKQTVRMIFITDNDNFDPITCPQIFFNIESGAELNLIEEHFSMGKSLNNHSLKFILQENACVRHFLFQNESENAVHINHTYVEQKRESRYYSYVLQQGAGHAIVQKTISLIEEKSSCELHGLSRPKWDQIFSNVTTVEHLSPETSSQQLYRGILEDQASLNFSGNVRVFQSAPKTDSGQLNQNLILSKDATTFSRPRLEIHNDDVKCTHGATCRDVNPDELFYLTSRGVDPKNCKELLIEGFAQDFYKEIKQFFPTWKP